MAGQPVGDLPAREALTLQRSSANGDVLLLHLALATAHKDIHTTGDQRHSYERRERQAEYRPACAACGTDGPQHAKQPEYHPQARHNSTPQPRL
ncbi:MAG: hypothetical protein WKH64_01355 [Chloroflexia bacterium]